MTDWEERMNEVWDRHLPTTVSREEVDEWFRKKHQELDRKWKELHDRWAKEERINRKKERKKSYQLRQLKLQEYLKSIQEKEQKCDEKHPLVSTSLRLSKFDPETIMNMDFPPDPLTEQIRLEFEEYKKSVAKKWNKLMKRDKKFLKKITKREYRKNIKRKIKHRHCDELTNQELSLMEYYIDFFVVAEKV